MFWNRDRTCVFQLDKNPCSGIEFSICVIRFIPQWGFGGEIYAERNVEK